MPYSASGLTNCGAVNDITSTNVTNICGSSSYYGGEDAVYIFTPTVTAAFNGSMTSTSTWAGMMLYQGCPTGTGVCVANSQSSSGNQSITSCTNVLTAGQTYYLVIDANPSPTCHPTYNLDLSLNTCSGAPAAGSAVATPSSNCANFTTTLTLSGGTSGCGITYQWYHSNTAGGTYTAIGAASSSSSQTFAVTSATPKFFKCVTMCGASSATTAVISASVSATSAGAGTYNISLPFSAANLTNCGSVNDITSSNVANICGSSSYYGGEDAVYIFTPTTTAIFTGSLSSSSSYVGMMLYQGCPTGTGVCVANSQSSSGNQAITNCTTSVTSGQTYYLVIDAFPSPTCHPTYNLDMSLSVCNSAPSGSVSASPVYKCGAYTTTLTLSNISPVCGVTIQWQHSTAAAGSYTNLGTAISQTVTVPAGTVRYYRAVLTCGAFSATTAVASATSIATGTCGCEYNVSLPYTVTGQTTCGQGDDLFTSGGGAVTNVCGSTSYYTGEDVLYSFTPTTSGTISVNVNSSGSFTGLMLYQGCPTSGGTCVANTQSSSGSKAICNASVTAGVKYYFILDSYASPTCNPYDLSIPAPTSSTVAPCNFNYSAAATTFSFETFSGTTLPLTDDVLFDDYIDLGFPFCFDGKSYSGGYVASNSSFVFDALPCFPNISSSSYAAGGIGTGYSISAAAPVNGTSIPRNAILAPWHDINPSATYATPTTKIQYQITGTSPNRKAVISWEDVPMFDCESDLTILHSSQVKIFEIDGSIEIHVKQKRRCSTWNGQDAVLGLHNYNGTVYIPPVNATAHNYPTNWDMTNEAYKFTSPCNNTGACLTVLPINFKEFNGDRINGVNTVWWSTALEENVMYFVVERSQDGINFTDIASIYAKNTASDYTYQDYMAPEGIINYYRVRSVETDGKIVSTNIISISGGMNDLLTTWPIYPNPTKTEVNVRLNSKKQGNATIVVNNIYGTKVIEQKEKLDVGVKVYSINVENLAKGVYFVEIQNDLNETITKQKLVIE